MMIREVLAMLPDQALPKGRRVIVFDRFDHCRFALQFNFRQKSPDRLDSRRGPVSEIFEVDHLDKIVIKPTQPMRPADRRQFDQDRDWISLSILPCSAKWIFHIPKPGPVLTLVLMFSYSAMTTSLGSRTLKTTLVGFAWIASAYSGI